VLRGNLRVCSCRAGFTGQRCESNINECATNPCANGATCTDRINDYHCACAPGYTGRNCAEPTDRCALQRCLNGGTCVTAAATGRATGLPSCLCPAGYSGPRCGTYDVPLDVTPSPNYDPRTPGHLNWTAVGLGVGLVAVLVLLCMALVGVRHVRNQRNRERDSEETMNNLSKADFQRENLIPTIDLKNTNKKMDLEVDFPVDKSNHKHVNRNHLESRTLTGYKGQLTLVDKDENCEKTMANKRPLSNMYR